MSSTHTEIKTHIRSSSPIELQLVRVAEVLQRKIDRLAERSRRISRIRGFIVLTGVVAYFVLSGADQDVAARIVALGAVVLFSGVAVLHGKVLRSKKRHTQYLLIKKRHLARLRRQWQDIPQIQSANADLSHPFESDLDLFGTHSVHHLVDTAFSLEGSQRLHQWLTQLNPNPTQTAWKQQLVKDLIPLTGFRDRITLETTMIGGMKGSPFQGNVLLEWLGAHHFDGRLRRILVILGILATATLSLFVLKMTSVVSSSWWVYSLVAYISVYLLNFKLYDYLFDQAEYLHEQFEKVLPVFHVIESFRFETGSALEGVAASLQDAEALPSVHAKKVMWVAMAASTQKSDILRIGLNLILPWDLLFTFILEKTKTRLKSLLPNWLDALQTLEAAGSLATFAYLNPSYSFPTWTNSPASTPLFDAAELGHPLIPSSAQVCNDFRMNRVRDLTLITGSNMSGKSTFLRTVGVNIALATAGGPVNAARMELTPFRMFTCIRVADSVNDGISYFYAEVKRLKRMLTELERDAGPGSEFPLIYFIDEVFRGTNNRERLIGSRDLLRQMCLLNGVGLVSTHDLDLTALADEIDGVTNYHFRESVEGRKMTFDYQLHRGPSPTTNALTIMELEGLIPKRS